MPVRYWHGSFASGVSGRAAARGLGIMRHSLLIRSTPFPTPSFASLTAVIVVTPSSLNRRPFTASCPSTRCLIMSATRRWRPAGSVRFGLRSSPAEQPKSSAASCPAASLVGLPPSSTGRHVAEVAEPPGPSVQSFLLLSRPEGRQNTRALKNL
jgi:hypothetical protein